MKAFLSTISSCALLAIISTFPATGADTAGDGWRLLFNGRDLSGWTPLNVAPNTFTVRDGMIVSTGVPSGLLRTDRHYENFELELEWRYLKPGGNAGVTRRKKADRSIGEWNRFVITLRGDRLTVNLNGETVIDNAQLPGVPARGPIALQDHGNPIEFGNLFVRGLPAP